MVKITDTTFRDAHQSLAATMMETKDMIPIAEKMNKLGLWSSEMSGGATFHKMILSRDEGGVDEYPWARMTQLYGLMPDTLLQILFRCQNAVG
jgi:pyruvate carboxylase subunit B